jgi:hypothetical protein
MSITTTIIKYGNKVKTIKLAEQEFEDILSSISFYKREYKKWKQSPLTYKAIVRLEKKLWKTVRSKK